MIAEYGHVEMSLSDLSRFECGFPQVSFTANPLQNKFALKNGRVPVAR